MKKQTICLGLITLLVLYLLGFRITYAPYLKNHWEAISACAAWTGVFISGLAICYAIKVPKTIADRQDRISLFEKRFKLYCIFKSLYRSSDLPLKLISDSKIRATLEEHIDSLFFSLTNCDYLEDLKNIIKNPKKEKEKLTQKLNDMSFLAQEFSFLFDAREAAHISNFLLNYITVLRSLCDLKTDKIHIDDATEKTVTSCKSNVISDFDKFQEARDKIYSYNVIQNLSQQMDLRL